MASLAQEPTKQQLAYAAFLAADKAWSEQLRLAFGKDAGDVRYTKRGEGTEGTPLNDAFREFKRAGDEWRRGM